MIKALTSHRLLSTFALLVLMSLWGCSEDRSATTAETAEEALLREIGEEWGLEMALDDIGEPTLLTITEINNPAKQSCIMHYDIWYFVAVDQKTFVPDSALLAKEYHFMKWLNPGEARKRITDSNTLQAVALLEEIFEQSHALNESAES